MPSDTLRPPPVSMAPPCERLAAHEVLQRHASHPSAFLALNRDTERLLVPGVDGFIAFRRAGGWLFQLGPAFAAERDRPALLAAFRAQAAREGRRIVALQLGEDDLPLYRDAGFRANPLGRSYTLELEGLSLAGGRFMQLRNKVRRAERAGVEVVEAGVGVPRTAALWGELEEVSARWLHHKGQPRELAFLTGELGQPEDALRRVFCARREGRLCGFVTLVPSYGRFDGMMHDLCRRTDDAPPGTMELLCLRAIERLSREGVRRVCFGLTPFMGLDEVEAPAGGSRFVHALLRLLLRRGAAIYPARSQAAYKQKWHPQRVTPEYLAFEGRFRLGALLRLLQVTRVL